MNVNVDIKGLDTMQRRIAKLADEWQEKALDITKEAAMNMQADAKRDCPVGDTGNLQNSIRLLIEDEGKTVDVVAGGTRVGGRDVDYAVYVEFGTRKMAARPFMRVNYKKWARWMLAEHRKLVKEAKRIR